MCKKTTSTSFRPPVCHCSIHGECETTEGNVVEVGILLQMSQKQSWIRVKILATNIVFQLLAGLLDEDQCAQACLDFQLCSNYTYFGPENPMRWVLRQLYLNMVQWWMTMVEGRGYFCSPGSSACSSPPAKTSPPTATTVMLGFPTARWEIVNFSS